MYYSFITNLASEIALQLAFEHVQHVLKAWCMSIVAFHHKQNVAAKAGNQTCDFSA